MTWQKWVAGPATTPISNVSSDNSYIQLTIAPESAGKSVATLVVALLGAEAAAPVLAHGGVWLNRRRVGDVDQPLVVGSELIIHRPPDGCYRQVTIDAADICYEDKWLLALNKQPGWYTTPTPWDAHNHIRGALNTWLQQRDGAAAPPLHLTHQLDRDTSGVLLCTKNRELNSPMQILFESGAIVKVYLCLCTGEPLQDAFELQSGHGRGYGGRWRLYTLDEVGAQLPNGKRIKFAHTSFTVEQRLGGATLLRAVLHTGRTHQIRLHLSALGYPLLGDAKYGGATHFRGRVLPFHLLHAACMELQHPVTEQPLTITAPQAAVMAELLAER